MRISDWSSDVCSSDRRLILHGKVAQDERVSAAVRSVRQDGHQVSVRVTWEAGDAARLTLEAVAEARRGEIDRIVAGGGDGTVDEVFVTAHRSEIGRASLRESVCQSV